MGWVQFLKSVGDYEKVQPGWEQLLWLYLSPASFSCSFVINWRVLSADTLLFQFYENDDTVEGLNLSVQQGDLGAFTDKL